MRQVFLGSLQNFKAGTGKRRKNDWPYKSDSFVESGLRTGATQDDYGKQSETESEQRKN